MDKFIQKSYFNSYLYNSEAQMHNKKLTEYIIKADRIDKNSDAFAGIKEEVRRRQTSSILYTVLNMDRVVLCINNVELSAAFKVFESNDIRANDNSRKVFIDVTGLIKLNGDYFVCKNIDKLITYLMGALTYIIYRDEPIKLINNSTISLEGTECFVSMVDYILDYLRVIGYSENKTKIAYITAIYFLYHMMDKDIDTYTKNIAARVAGITAVEAKRFDIYYSEEDFKDINTFINMIAKVFKLKGLTTEVFIQRWLYSYTTGTQFATELFTSFSVLLTNAYCGSYVVNQKQIERCCGTHMVKYAVEILKIGTSMYDNRGMMESTELEKRMFVPDKASEQLLEAFNRRKSIPEDAKFTAETYKSKSEASKTTKSLIKYYRSCEKEDKIAEALRKAALNALPKMKACISKNDGSYEDGVLLTILAEYKKYKNPKVSRSLDNEINSLISKLDTDMKKSSDDKEKSKRYSKAIIELRKASQYT